MHARFIGLFVAVVAFALAQLAPALAQSTAQSNRVVVGYPPGGASDIVARLLAERLREGTGEPFIVENKPGAGGRIAAEQVKAAAPDGRTLMLAPVANIGIYPHTVERLRYDPFRDFAPIALAGSFDIGIATGPATNARTLAEFVAWVKANPKQGSFGAPTAGSLPHFFGLLFAEAAGLEMVLVNYKGSGPAVNDVIGGQLPAVSTTMADLIAQHKSGRLRVLAHSGAQRNAQLPEVPTFKELGYRGLEGGGWYGLFATGGSPEAAINRYNAIVVRALQTADLRARFAALGREITLTTPQQFARIIREDSDRWGKVIRASGFKAEE